MSVSECGEETGEQNLDWMDKNCVKRRGVLDELAIDSEIQKGSKQLCVKAARIRGKQSHLIRGGLLEGEAEVSRGRSIRWSNDHPGQSVKADHRAKGRTVEKENRSKSDSGEDIRNLVSRHIRFQFEGRFYKKDAPV